MLFRSLTIPPLRERVGEIEHLASVFLQQAYETMKPGMHGELSPEAMDALKSYWWPGNIRELRNAIERTREGVTDGKTIAEPLARSQVFPQLMIDLLKIGEETGDVPGSLENIADTYENELTLALRVLTNLIEPTMIICIAVGVGFLLYSVLSAMFAITRSIGQG